MFGAQLAILGGTQKSLVQKAIAILQKYGTNAHVFLPGIGTINGLQAANYLDYTETIGSEQLQNPTFAAATGWTQGSGWTISGGMATATTASGALTQTALVLGQYDQVQITTTAVSAGNFDVILGGVKLTTISTVGTFTVRGTAGGTTLSLQGNGYTGVLTLASVKSVTGASVTLGNVDSTVGQMVDAGHVGPELSPQTSGFTSTTGFSSSNSTLSVSGGNLVMTSTASSGTMQLNFGPSAANGAVYTSSITVVANSALSSSYYVGGTGGGSSGWPLNSVGATGVTAGLIQTATSTQTLAKIFYAVSAVGQSVTFSLLSVKQLTGINAFQATSGNRPTLRRGLVNLLSYSQDFTNAVWDKAAFSGSTASLVSIPDHLGITRNVSKLTVISTLHYTYQSNLLSAGATATVGVWLRSDTPVSFGYIFYGNSSGVQSGVFAVTTNWQFFTVTRTYSISDTDRRFGLGWGFATSAYVSAIGLFAGNVTPTEIPLTTTAPASSSTGNYSLEFNGSNYLQMAQPLFQTTDDFAIIAGFIPGVSGLNSGMFSVDNASNSTTAELITLSLISGAPQIYMATAGQTRQVVAGSTSPGVAAVSTGLKIGTNLALRLNGSQLGTTSTTGQAASSFTRSSLGCYYPNAGLFSGSTSIQIALKNPTLADVQVLEKFVGMLTGPTGVYF